MKIDRLITELEDATLPDSHLDHAIANIVDLYFPGRLVTAQKYTSSLDAAFSLAQLAAPGHAGGASWEEEGVGTAAINDGPFHRAATPAMALCLAALKLLKSPTENSASAGKPIKGPWRIAKIVNKSGASLQYRLRKVGTEVRPKVIELEVDAVFSHGLREAGSFEIFARSGDRTIRREITFAEDEHAKVVVLE
jgi:hypothetical protein